MDISEIACGMNAALYFIQMDLDGGKSRGGANEAGARYGTGYCDAQVGIIIFDCKVFI